MSKAKQNIIMLMEQPKGYFDISLQAANMCWNRFCIDEEAGFESSGVYSLEQGSKSRQKSCTIRTIFTTKVLLCTIFQLSQ